MVPESDRTEVMGRVESRLVAGYPRQRLAVECGIPSGHLDRMVGLDFREKYYERPGGRSEDDHRYYGKVDAYFEALEVWLSESTREQTSIAFAATPTYQALCGIYDTTRASNDLSAVIGGVGIGKSLTAKSHVTKYPRTQQNPGFVYVPFNDGCASSGAALHAILYALIGEHAHH